MSLLTHFYFSQLPPRLLLSVSSERNCGFGSARLEVWRACGRPGRGHLPELTRHNGLISLHIGIWSSPRYLPDLRACVRACVDFLSQSRLSVRLSVRFVRPGALIHQSCYRLLSIYYPSPTPSPTSLLKPLSYSLSLLISPLSHAFYLCYFTQITHPIHPFSSSQNFPLFFFILFSENLPSAVHAGCWDMRKGS